MKIIGGIVSYEDGVKTVEGDQFSPTRKVRVELNFSLDDGEKSETAIATVLDQAQSFVMGKLNLKAPTAAARSTAKPASDPKPAATGKSDKEKLAEANGVGSDAQAKIDAAAAKKAAGPKRPAAKPADDALGEETPPAAKEEDGLDELFDATEAPKEITDADLNHAVQTKNRAVANPKAIKALVATYNPDETKAFTLREIPAGKRAEFVEKLEKITEKTTDEEAKKL